MKKSAIIIISIILIIIIALIFFLISLLKTKSYSVEYSIDGYKISEYYYNDNKLFYYEINKDNIIYNFIYESKYLKERKLITGIKTYNEENETCITISSNYIKSYPLCSSGSELIDYHLINDNLKSQLEISFYSQPEYEKEIKKYILYNESQDIYIWNYKGFNHIKNGTIEYIKLFNKDIYDIPLATKINNYILIPDYNQEYTFNKIYIIDLNTDKLDTWTLTNNISYDSYILGINDKSVFLVDQKNKREYELVPHKKKMRIIATENKQGLIYNNGIEEKTSMKKLTSTQKTFIYKNIYNYKIIDNKLYLYYLDKKNYIKVSDNVSSIINIKNDNIYYLVDNILYRYNLDEGNTKQASYSEWSYNNKNVIFINN